MNKKIKVTSVAAAALASLVLSNVNLSNEVKADTKPVDATAKTTEKAQTPEEAARANVANAQKNVEIEQGNVDKTKGALDQAKKDAEKPDADYKAQSDKVASLKKIADQKNDALTDAKNKADAAQDLANEAKDPAKVQAAKDAVTKQEGVVKKANDEKQSADQDVTNKQTEINRLGKKVESDTQDVKDKTAAKDKADHDVQVAEDALKGTGIKEAKKNLDDANDAVAKTQKALAKAKDDIRAALKDQATAQEALKDAQPKYNNAVKDQKAALKRYKDAKEKSNITYLKIEKLNSEIESLNNKLPDLEINAENRIYISKINYYKEMLKDYLDHKELTSKQIDFLNTSRQQSHYISSDKDKKTIVDLKNLTDDQIEDLSLFALNLTNTLRAQFGLKPEVVSKGSIEVAKEIAQKYKQDYEGTLPAWHDEPALKQVRSKHNIYALGEAMDSYYTFSSITNMDDLKHKIFDMYKSLVFSDGNGIDKKGGDSHYELGHAMVLIGLEEINSNIESVNNLTNATDKEILKYYQHEIQSKKDEIKSLESQNPKDESEISLLKGNLPNLQNELKKVEQKINGETYPMFMALIPTDHGLVSRYGREGIAYHYLYLVLDNESKIDQTPIPSYSSQIENLEKDLENKNDKLPQLELEFSKLKFNTDKALSKLKEAKGTVSGFESQKNDANDKIQKANSDLKIAQEEESKQKVQLSKNEFNQKAAKDHYNNLTTDKKTQVDYLEKVQKAQEDANNKLIKLQKTLDQARQDLDQAKKELPALQQTASEKGKAAQKAQDKLKDLIQHVKDLRNATTNLAKAMQAVADAQKAYNTSDGDYKAAKKF